MELDLLNSQMIIYSSKRYEEIYKFFNEKYAYKYAQLFLLCASIGARRGSKIELDGHGREFRSNYLETEERRLAYTIILNDEEFGKNIENFGNKEFYSVARNLLEKYAEGGMDILVNEVFKEKWSGQKMDDTYDGYIFDLLSYTLTTLEDVPF